MIQAKSAKYRLHTKIYSAIFLAFFWCVGLCVGVSLAFCSPDSISSLLHLAVLQKLSIVNIIAILLLPHFVTFLFLILSAPYGVLLIAFLKAAGLSYLLIGVLTAFGSAGWLISMLLLFSDLLSAVFLIRIWFAVLQKRARCFDFLFSGVFLILIGIIDCYIVSPFLATLFHIN